METVKTLNGYLPFFPGFYESDYENSDTGYYAIREAIDDSLDAYGVELTEDDFNFDYSARHKDIVEVFCEAFKDYSPEWVTSVKPLALVSPRYYNYDSDKIDAEIGLDDSWRESMKTYINEYKADLAKIIEENHTSYDGFVSFMSNRLETWEAIIFNSDKIDSLIEKYGVYSDEYIDALKEAFPNISAWDIKDNYRDGDADKYIIYMIGYIMYLNYKKQGGFLENLYYQLLYNTLDEISDWEYVITTDEADAKIKEAENQYSRD